MIAITDTAQQATPERTAKFLTRFPPRLYQTLRRHCLIERQERLSINAFIVLAVQQKLSDEGVPLP